MPVTRPQTRRDHSDFWLDPPVTPIKPDMVPDVSDIDLRALVEKARKRELMDIEWRRQQVCARVQEGGGEGADAPGGAHAGRVSVHACVPMHACESVASSRMIPFSVGAQALPFYQAAYS